MQRSQGDRHGSLAITRAQPSVSVSGDERNSWALIDRAERAKDSAFKCCGVIEVMTGGDVHDPTAASNGGVSANGLAGVGDGIGSEFGSVAGSGGGSDYCCQHGVEPAVCPAPSRGRDRAGGLVDRADHGAPRADISVYAGVREGRGSGGTCWRFRRQERRWQRRSRGIDSPDGGALAAYEESIKKQVDLTLEARREHLREQSQPMGFALCFAAQNRACAAELLERKRAEMTALHEATIGVMRAGKVQPLLVRAERARQRWSGLLVDEELHALGRPGGKGIEGQASGREK